MSTIASADTLGSAFNSIPVIDIANASTPEQRATLAHKIRNVCINVGFFYITGHGIPQETVDNMFSAMEAYFSLPLKTKMKLYHKGVNFKGYIPPLDSNVDSANRGDFSEGFEGILEEIASKENGKKGANDSTMAGTNAWPSEPAGFREAYLNYYHAAVGVGRLLFRLFALALDLPETYFDDKTRKTEGIMRTIHYPPQTGPVSDGYVGMGAHSDFLCFTMLWQSPDAQALQVLNSEKRWVNATPIPGTLVVNIGDQLTRWTNDLFQSTLHRVVNRSGMHRYSAPLFFGTDDDVLVEPLPSCISAERPPKYEPVTSGEYLQKRFRETYHGRAPPS